MQSKPEKSVAVLTENGEFGKTPLISGEYNSWAIQVKVILLGAVVLTFYVDLILGWCLGLEGWDVKKNFQEQTTSNI